MKRFISVLLTCLMLMSAMFSIGACAKEEKVYYLFGYINGANYACEEDYQNMGEYRFENGKLTARFDVVSYVAVKEENNLNWYMTNGWMGDVYSVKLLNTNITGAVSDKLKVPAGVDVNFTLVENDDGTLTLSYEAENEGYSIRAELWDYVNIDIKILIESAGNYWTEESEKPFLQALQAANEALDNPDAKDKELLTAYNNLKTAERNLKVQDNEYWTDKLSALTDEYSMDFENIKYQYTVYTKDSFDKYLSAYRSANSAIGNDELFWFDLSQEYYNLKNARKALVRLDGKDIPDPDKKPYETEKFKTLLSAYGKEIGIGGDVMDNDGEPVERTLDGREVIEYRGIRIFNCTDNLMVFGLSDMWCTVGEEVIGEYCFLNPLFYGVDKNKSGLCVYYNGRIYTIKDAVNEDVITVEKLASIIPFTEKAGKIYPTIPSATTPETTNPTTVPTKPSDVNRPTMPVIIPDDGRYEVETDPINIADEINTTSTEPIASESVSETTGNNVTEAPETTEANKITPVKETEAVRDGELVTVEPTSVSSTEPTEPQETSEVLIDKPSESEAVQSAVNKVKKANPIKISVNSKTLKAKKLKKSRAVIKPVKIKNAKGRLNIVKVKDGTNSKIYKNISVNGKTGVVTIKKGKYSKKTYNVRLKITVSGNSSYKPKTIYKTVKIKIK